jgi:hypothetical protein
MPVLESVLSVAVSFWWLWLIALLILLLRVPAIKGWFGERLVEVSLRLSLPSDVYQVCHDITGANRGLQGLRFRCPIPGS